MHELIVPVVTPFENGRLSVEKLRLHSDYLLKKGVDFIFLNGSTGLGPSMNLEERLQVLHAFQDIPEKVIVQVGGLNLDESLTLAREASKFKVHAIASLPPYYYPRLPENWLIRYFKAISEVYPTYLYNFPLTTGYDINAAMVRKILSSGANVIGIKDTVPDINHMLEIKWNTGPEFKVFCGPDPLIMSALRSGLDGAVGGSGNYIPGILRTLVDHYNDEVGMKAQRLVQEVTNVVKKYGQWSANYSMVEILHSYSAGEPRPPIFPLGDEEKKSLSQEVKKVLPKGDSL